MSQHWIDENRVQHPRSGQRPEPVPSGRRDEDVRSGPGAMRQPHAPEAIVSDISRPAARPSPNGGTSPGEQTADASLAALDALSGALSQIAEDLQVLQAKLAALRSQRAGGMAWRDILASEEAPGSMQIVSRMLARLAKASGTLRKELVDTLRREGVSIPAIARMFGVTHQRVSNLLRRPAE